MDAAGWKLRLSLACITALSMGTLPVAAETFSFRTQAAAEVIAELEMSSPGSDWSQPGREAALATLTLDDQATQHVMLTAGEHRQVYRVMLGELDAGDHHLRIERNAQYSAPPSQLAVHSTKVREIPRGDPMWPVVAHAPYLYARANTVGRFSDVPLLAYCERITDQGSPLLQYTVIFSNEDGGTSTRALMARWGRTTDIEYIYRAFLDPSGAIARATMQARDHKDVPFAGRREGTHPLLIPATQNNMVADTGDSAIRYQPAPELVDLSEAARESVMNRNPWTYRVMAQELIREEKIRPFGTVRGETVSDPRDYLYVEASAIQPGAGLAVLVRPEGSTTWYTSHLGRLGFLVSRDGWFQTTVELPPGTARIAEIGFTCLVADAKSQAPDGSCRLQRVNQTFLLDSDYRPRPSLFSLREAVTIPTGQVRTYHPTQ